MTAFFNSDSEFIQIWTDDELTAWCYAALLSAGREFVEINLLAAAASFCFINQEAIR